MLRNLQRGGIYSAINVGGLAIGMAASVLLLIWVYNQWSYDRFHPKAKQIHQVWSRSANEGVVRCWQATSLVIGPAMKDLYPEIVESVRVASYPRSYLFGEGDRYLDLRVMYTDPSFLTMFSFPLLHGDANTALNDPYSVILTEKAARRLFGDEDPMGKTLMHEMKNPVTVTGVMKDLPNNTRFDFEILGALKFWEMVMDYTASWGNMGPETFVELSPYAQLDRLNESVRDIIKNHTDNRLVMEAFLYPLDKSYLYNNFDNGVPSGGRIGLLRMFFILAAVILTIACLNFVNLSTARSSLRAKEVGVRKVMGSRRSGLIRLFLSESIMMAAISGFFAIIIVHEALPYFSGWLGGFIGKSFSVDFSDIRFWLFALAFILFTGLLAGSYPAFLLSAFRPVKVLKGIVAVGGSRVTLRKFLVVLQFTFAIFLIIGTLVIRRQIIHTQNRDAGYDKERLIHIPLPEGIKNHYAAFRNDLTSSGAVTDMTRAWEILNSWANSSSPRWRGKDPEDRRGFNLYFADGNWAKMMGAEIVAGRFPDAATFPTDSFAIVINEATAEMIGFDDPIGERLSYWGYEGHITGVIKNFVLHSPFVKPEPMIIGSEKLGSERKVIYIRLSPGKTADRLATVESIFKRHSAGYPFIYQFDDDDYAAHFKDVQAMESLTGSFTVIAILISCMGLFALTSLTVERRRKEIGIRKVLGATIFDIIWLVSREYIFLTVIAFAIAAPLAWLTMNQLLSTFDYRTNIPAWLIVAVGALILLIALLTVGFQAIKAATQNPVKAIKSE